MTMRQESDAPEDERDGTLIDPRDPNLTAEASTGGAEDKVETGKPAWDRFASLLSNGIDAPPLSDHAVSRASMY